MTLFQNPDCRNKNGFIQVVTDQPYYEPGMEVTGIIYVRIHSMISAVKGIDLQVKGSGKHGFTHHHVVFEPNALG